MNGFTNQRAESQIPVMVLMMNRDRMSENLPDLKSLIPSPVRRLKKWELIAYPAIIVSWAGGVFVVIGTKLNPFLEQWLFPGLPTWLNISHLIVQPEAYHPAWLPICWAAGFVLVTIVGPVAEEIYFSGFLLPRIPGKPATVIITGAVLFSVYHFFSLWMVPVRIIALIPLVFVAWKTRSVTVAVVGHYLLNFIGDTVGMIPLVFNVI